MKIFHLSHTDLDGYGAQFVLSKYFKDIVFLNSNYGKEIEEQFNKILSMLHADEENFILITDLNLALVQCEEFEKAIENKNCKLMLLDHHQTGEACFKKYPWYFLDSSKSATKITYEFFSQIYGENQELKKLVDVVNAVDIWLSQDDNFELGKVCLGLIANAKEVNRVMFEELNHDYMFHLLNQVQNYLDQEQAHILLDDNIHKIKKSFFIQDENNTLSNLISNFIVQALSQNVDKFSINYENFRGVLTYNIGNTSIIGNEFLVKNPQFDFFVDVSSRKTLSFRANDRVDVSQMAAFLVGGGGHKNASGGMFVGFRDSFVYEKVKNQIQNLINTKLQSKIENTQKADKTV